MLENLVREKYYITHKLHTSYNDIDEITRTERCMLLRLIADEMQQIQQQRERYQNSNNG